VLIAGSLALMMAVLFLFKVCCPSFINVHQLSKRFASVFVGIVFWVVVLTLLSGSRRD
jgi:hypothetical protein